MKPISYIKIGVKGNIKNPHLKKKQLHRMCKMASVTN
jgi:hypothetical protein